MTLALLLVSAVAASAAPDAEALRRFADTAFFDVSMPVAPPLAPTQGELPEGQQPDAQGREVFLQYLKNLSSLLPGIQETKPAKGPGAYLRLADVRNNYLKTAAVFGLDGKNVTAGFVVSRKQDAYLSLAGEDGKAPLANIKGLLDKKRSVTVNGKEAEVSLSPNIFDKLASKISVKGASNARAFKLRDLIAATQDKGFTLPLNGRSYRVFFYDDVNEQDGLGAVDASRQNVTLLLREKDEFHIYIIPYEDVPADKISVFTLFEDARLGLQRLEDGAVLGLYPNP